MTWELNLDVIQKYGYRPNNKYSFFSFLLIISIVH